MDTKKIYFDAFEGVVSDTQGDRDAGDEGAELSLIVVGCS